MTDAAGLHNAVFSGSFSLDRMRKGGVVANYCTCPLGTNRVMGTMH